MIIRCNNCNKNFDIDSSLIPEKGRLLQCSSCNHKWFFKKKIKENSVPIVKIKAIIEEPTPYRESVTKEKTETPNSIELLDRVTEDVSIVKKISIQSNNKIDETIRIDKEPNTKISKNKKSFNILSLTIIFIISFVAIIIVLDTFQKPISMFVPNIEFILYNLYETINDIALFFSDLML